MIRTLFVPAKWEKDQDTIALTEPMERTQVDHLRKDHLILTMTEKVTMIEDLLSLTTKTQFALERLVRDLAIIASIEPTAKMLEAPLLKDLLTQIMTDRDTMVVV